MRRAVRGASGFLEEVADRRQLAGTDCTRAFELVEMSTRDGERGRPSQWNLRLGVELVELDLLRGRDLVTRHLATREQTERVEPARDLRAEDVAVVPVRGPQAREH